MLTSYSTSGNLLLRIRIPRPSIAPVPARVPTTAPESRSDSGAPLRVALGILGSRLTGLVRESLTGHFFGVETIAADAFRAALRVPTLLSNLFGEGVLSAAFVTVYSKLRAAHEDEEARHVAAAIFGILAVVCSVLVLAGVLLAPYLIDFIAPGFHGEERRLTIRIVQILFPGTGILVMSAWCLGVLNSHRRFLLSYLSPVAVNFVVIAALAFFGPRSGREQLVIYAAWAFVIGYLVQFLIQLPRVLRVLPGFRPAFEWRSTHVRSVIKNFGPIFLSRGVVQLSAYIDSMIASELPRGAVAILGYAQYLSILPISLFSMSVSAAELPAMSSALGDREEIAAILRRRLSAGLRNIAFFIVPSAVAFLVLGDVVGGAIYQSGRFSHADAIYLWSVLAGSAVGLLASSLGRLYSSAFYALLDTRTPLRFAVIRVLVTTGLGLLCAFQLPGWFGFDQRWAVAGLTASAGIAGWLEFTLLRNALNRRIGKTGLPPVFLIKLWSIALAGAFVGYSVKLALGTAHPKLLALLVLPIYGVIYFGGTMWAKVPESASAVHTVLRRFRF